MDDQNEVLAPGDDAPGSGPVHDGTVAPEPDAPGDDAPGATHENAKDTVLQRALSDAKAVGAGVTKTAASILGGPMAGYNMEADWFTSLYKKATGETPPTWLVDKYNVATPDWLMKQFNNIGLPTEVDPKAPDQRYIAAASGGAAAGAPGGVPGVVSGVLGGVSGEAAKDMGLGKWGQLGASVLGALSPTGARALLQRILQVNPAVAAENISNVERTGGSATLGQAAGPGTNAQVLEDALSKIPGPAGVVRGAVARNNDAATQTINDMADGLNAPSSKNAAGSLIQNTVENQTVPDLRARVAAAYQARAAAVPKGTQVDVSGLLDTISAQAAKNPNFRQMLATDPVFQEIYNKLQGGAGWTKTTIGGKPGWIKPDNSISFTPPPASTKLAFEDADNLSQQVGQMVDMSYNKASSTNVVNGALSQVSAQFRRDISGTLQTIPGAQAADRNAVNVWQQAEAQKAQLRKVLNSDDPERAYDLMVSGAKDAEGRLDAVFRGLPADQQNMVSATIMRRMGMAVPSKQGAAGEAWSSETFLSNWNKVSDGSKAILLRNMPPEYRDNLDAIAQYAENVRQGASVYGNPSGTGSKMAQLTGVTTSIGATASALHSLAHVSVPVTAIATLGPYAGMYMTAKVLTNPSAVRWLAAATRLPPASAPIIAAQLGKVAQQSNDPDTARLAAAFGKPPQQQQQQ